MNTFETLQRQPNFPNEDLQDGNVNMVEYYLEEIQGSQAHAEHLRESLRMVHITAHEALRLCGIEVEYSQQEYDTFCKGFASFEYMSLLVNPRELNGAALIQNTKELLINPGDNADVGIAERRENWIKVFPNVYGLVVDAGARQGDSFPQLQSRTIGAQIACELQMAA